MMQPRGNSVLNSSCTLLFLVYLAVKYHKLVDVSINSQNDIFNITAKTDDYPQSQTAQTLAVAMG